MLATLIWNGRQTSGEEKEQPNINTHSTLNSNFLVIKGYLVNVWRISVKISFVFDSGKREMSFFAQDDFLPKMFRHF